MINRMQDIFNRLAGIAILEAERFSRAHAIFVRDEAHLAGLEKPACWRRSPKVRERSRHR